jgi:hypothetical protein
MIAFNRTRKGVEATREHFAFPRRNQLDCIPAPVANYRRALTILRASA